MPSSLEKNGNSTQQPWFSQDNTTIFLELRGFGAEI